MPKLLLYLVALTAAVAYALVQRQRCRQRIAQLSAAVEETRSAAHAAAATCAAQVDAQELRRIAVVQQSLSEQYLRRQSQAALDESMAMIVTILQDVVTRVDAVRQASATIDGGVVSVQEVMRQVVDGTHAADAAVAALDDSLKRVGGIAGIVSGVGRVDEATSTPWPATPLPTVRALRSVLWSPRRQPGSTAP